MTEWNSRKQIAIKFFVLCPLFLIFSLLSAQWREGSEMDFGAYWQAGHMILSGQNVYDSQQWIAVRQILGTAFHSEPTFQYPLPVALLFAPVALLPIQPAYTFWMFFMQVSVLISIEILLDFFPIRSGYLELLAITGVFFFRPMFTIVNSGQFLGLLLLLLSLSIKLFADGNWFLGGFVLSVLNLKPSLGLPVMLLSGLWFLSRKQWKGIWGMMTGGLALMLIGALVNPRWPLDYLSVGGDSFSKYYGMQPTLWGGVDKIFQADSLSMTISLVCVMAVVAVEAYLFWRNTVNENAFPAFASIVPAALLIAPYSWHHDQILLVVSIIFVLISVAAKYGIGWAVLFMSGIVGLPFAMVAVAYQVGHDVWSVLNSFVIWVLVLYFVSRNNRLPNEQELTSRTSTEGILPNKG